MKSVQAYKKDVKNGVCIFFKNQFMDRYKITIIIYNMNY